MKAGPCLPLVYSSTMCSRCTDYQKCHSAMLITYIVSEPWSSTTNKRWDRSQQFEILVSDLTESSCPGLKKKKNSLCIDISQVDQMFKQLRLLLTENTIWASVFNSHSLAGDEEKLFKWGLKLPETRDPQWLPFPQCIGHYTWVSHFYFGFSSEI